MIPSEGPQLAQTKRPQQAVPFEAQAAQSELQAAQVKAQARAKVRAEVQARAEAQAATVTAVSATTPKLLLRPSTVL